MIQRLTSGARTVRAQSVIAMQAVKQAACQSALVLGMVQCTAMHEHPCAENSAARRARRSAGGTHQDTYSSSPGSLAKVVEMVPWTTLHTASNASGVSALPLSGTT